ncbi:MAG: type II secretion system protein [Gammaproteobacteria bacterium]
MTVGNKTAGFKNQGFTLIEIVMVLILLGILGSFLMMRFMDLQKDVVLVTLEKVKGTLYSTNGIYRSLAAIRGVQTGTLLVNGENLRFHSGFPDGRWNDAFRGMLEISTKSTSTPQNAMCANYRLCGTGNRNSIPSVPGTTGGRGIIIWPEGYRIANNCFAYFYNTHDGNEPLIGVVDSGC